MPSHLVSRLDLDLLEPRFLEAVLETLAACEKRNAHYYATYGYRSPAEQLKLWTQGRTVPGKVVTNAGPLESLHNFGLAMDLVRDRDMAKAGLQPEWGPEGYRILKEEGRARGLQVALKRKDGTEWDDGHVQIPLKYEKTTLRELKRVWEATEGDDRERLRACWAALDAYVPSPE